MYPAGMLAKTSLLEKLKDKLTKGYVGRDAKKKESSQSEKSELIKRPAIKSSKSFSGEYY